jgi:phage shock protein C
MALMRTMDNKIIAGVCGGLAVELNMDPVLVRVLTIVIALLTAIFPLVVGYVILWIVMPEAPVSRPPGPSSGSGDQSPS